MIIDAASLKAEQRAGFRALASIKRIPYTILEFSFPESTLRHQIKNRTHGAFDADLTVLEHQMAAVQKLGPDETLMPCAWIKNDYKYVNRSLSQLRVLASSPLERETLASGTQSKHKRSKP